MRSLSEPRHLGTLAVYHDGVEIGLLVRTGLKYLDLVWMVQLADGSEVRIEKKDPVESTADVRSYMKRVGLGAWIQHFDNH